MKLRELFKDIFTLAVRLLGLFFLYLGLKDVPTILDMPTIQRGDVVEILNSALPVAFNLIIAWWLIGGGLLIRRAYPKIAEQSFSPAEPTTPLTAGSAPPRQSADMDSAEKKLATLLGKPGDPGKTR